MITQISASSCVQSGGTVVEKVKSLADKAILDHMYLFVGRLFSGNVEKSDSVIEYKSR